MVFLQLLYSQENLPEGEGRLCERVGEETFGDLGELWPSILSVCSQPYFQMAWSSLSTSCPSPWGSLPPPCPTFPGCRWPSHHSDQSMKTKETFQAPGGLLLEMPHQDAVSYLRLIQVFSPLSPSISFNLELFNRILPMQLVRRTARWMWPRSGGGWLRAHYHWQLLSGLMFNEKCILEVLVSYCLFGRMK